MSLQTINQNLQKNPILSKSILAVILFDMNTTSRGALRGMKSSRRFYRCCSKYVAAAPPCHLLRVNRRTFTMSSSDENLGNLSREEVIKKRAAVANGNQLLDEAAAEGRRIFDFCQLDTTDVKSPLTNEKLHILEDALDRFLAVTIATVPLSQAITIFRNEERVQLLHRAFLTIVQKCVSTLMQVGSPENPTSLLSSNPPLLEKTLQLVTRAREDLNLPFPLPLYQWLAVSVSQSSDTHATITKWIMQAGRWARDDFGSDSLTQENQEFFAQPLRHLAVRKRYTEMAEILLLVLESESFAVNYLRESSLKEILSALDDDLQIHVWKPTRSASISPLAQVLMEILLLLEPSIWRVFGYSTLSPDRMDSLRDAIEIILSQENDQSPDNTSSSSLSLYADSPELIQAFFREQFPDNFPTPEDDYYDDADEDETYDPPKGTWEIHLDMDSDLAIVGVSRISHSDEEYDYDHDDDGNAEDDDNDDDDSQDTQRDREELYTRSMLPGTLPDVVSQIEQVIGKPLQYSKRLEEDLIRAMDNFEF